MAITETYANFDLADGLNNGTSEANAWQTPGVITYVAGERVNIKETAARHTLTVNHTGSVAGSTTQPVYVRGYTTTIGDGGSVLLDAATYTWSYTGDNVIAENFDIIASGAAWITAFDFFSDGGLIKNLKVVKTTTGAMTDPAVDIQDGAFENIFVECRGNTSSTAAGLVLGRAAGTGAVCKSVNGQSGINIQAGYRVFGLSHLLSYSEVTTTLAGIEMTGSLNTVGGFLSNFTVDGFGEGFLIEDLPTVVANPIHITNGIISGATNAIANDATTTRTGITFGTIAFYNNTNDYAEMDDNVVINPVALTADPYEDSANDDFRPNTTAGGGALLRGAVEIGAGDYTTNLDIGALQHADPAGGGGGAVSLFNGTIQ